ncbi:MAG: heme-binding protein [Thermoplasmata archaeon]
MTGIQTRKILNLAGAEAVMNAAEAFANEKGYRVVIAIVDSGGQLLLLRRLAEAQVASVNVAIDKARTAAAFMRPSRVLEEQVTAGRLGALALRGGVALTGGIPLVVDGEVVGAIGTSGETPDEDESVSIAGSKTGIASEEVRVLTYEGARSVTTAVAKEATSRGVAPVVSVVDAAGDLVYLWRPDAAQVASVNVSLDKARTAAIYRRPSKDFEDQASHGRPSALALHGGVPLQGGIPVVSQGQVVGAIGVSGASSADEDQELAAFGVKAADSFEEGGAHPLEVFYKPGAEVVAKFETGGLMLETPLYKVDAGRREASGEVEYHEGETDIMYVLEGTATVVTGGEMIEARDTGPGEVRAASIKEGTTHHLGKGDVLVVPRGVPHWFREVEGPLLYFVVKAISPIGDDP